jgi:methyl-accepting chemotaxis protein
MQSIRYKLLQAFLSIMILLSCIGIFLFFSEITAVNQYKAIVDSVLAEYRLLDLSSGLTVQYNLVSKNVDNQETLREYNQIKNSLQETFENLDNAIVDEQNKADYAGLKNTILAELHETDTGISDIKRNKIEDISKHYEEANRQFDFVKTNATTLIIDELKYSNSLQKRIQQFYETSLIIAVAVFVLILLICLFFAISFSRAIVLPLKKLTLITQSIASGDMQTQMDPNLLKEKNEIGVLANSFKLMIDNLQKTLQKLNESNQEILKAKTDLEQKNNELERMNSIMLGREMKIIELKKEIATLKGETV